MASRPGELRSCWLIAPHEIHSTVVFTDIVGSTDQLAMHGDQDWRAVLDAHDRAMAEAIDQFGGELIETTGDGVLAIFDDPNHAIEAIAAANRRLAELELQIRSGMHTGSIVLRGGGVSGLVVHIASRITGESTAGEILVSELTARGLSTSWRASTRGTFELKGVREPMTLVTVHYEPAHLAAPRRTTVSRGQEAAGPAQPPDRAGRTDVRCDFVHDPRSVWNGDGGVAQG